MFPLKVRKIGGYKFGVKTSYSNFHLGVDYSARYVPLYVPFDGMVVNHLNGDEGGLTVWFHPNKQDVIIRFLHLSKLVKIGNLKEGEQIAVTGNTGTSDTPHLHLDISKHQVLINNTRNFIDPEKFNWGSSLKEDHMFRTYKGTIYLLGAGFWIAVGTTGEEFKQDWNVSDFPPEMTEAQFKAFPVNKRTIK